MSLRSLALAAAVLLLLPSAGGWSGDAATPHHADLAELALRSLPPEQVEAILPWLAAYREGAIAADTTLDAHYHRYEAQTGEGGALLFLDRAVLSWRAGLVDGRIDEADANVLGTIAHVLFDLSQPLHTGTDAIGGRGHREYEERAYDLARVPSPIVRPIDDVSEEASRLANASADLAPELLSELDREDDQWSPRIGQITHEALAEGAASVASILHQLLPAETAGASGPSGPGGEPGAPNPLWTASPLLAALLIGTVLASRRRARG